MAICKLVASDEGFVTAKSMRGGKVTFWKLAVTFSEVGLSHKDRDFLQRNQTAYNSGLSQPHS